MDAIQNTWGKHKYVDMKVQPNEKPKIETQICHLSAQPVSGMVLTMKNQILTAKRQHKKGW